MNDTKRKAVVLWLSGACLADMRTIAEVERLSGRSAAVELIPAPITNTQSLSYQLVTGRRPERFGFFDTLVLHGYTVVEDFQGRDSAPASFADLLSAAGWAVKHKELTIDELVECVRSWAQADHTTASCLMVKCALSPNITKQISASLAAALRTARTAVGDMGLLAIISDGRPAPIRKFVNINNFLAEMGIIERKEQDGSIDWSNTLAHYMGHGQIWINLQGRDAQGIVNHQDEYEEVSETLVKALPIKVRDPQTGEAVIECVYRKEELYQSDYLFCAPDLIVVFKPGYIPSANSTKLGFDDAAFTPAPAGTLAIDGAHPTSVNGFLLASAPAFVQGRVLSEPVPLTTVVPTLLHALEVNYGAMENTALKEFFVPYYLDLHPIKEIDDQQVLSDEEEELVINRLRDLGYI